MKQMRAKSVPGFGNMRSTGDPILCMLERYQGEAFDQEPLHEIFIIFAKHRKASTI